MIAGGGGPITFRALEALVREAADNQATNDYRARMGEDL